MAKQQTEEQKKVEYALDWCVEQSEDGKTCPFDGWRSAIPEGDATDHKLALRNHIQKNWLYKAITCYEAKSIEGGEKQLRADALHPIESTGEFEIVDSFDDSGLLRIPNAVKRELKSSGDGTYWVPTSELTRYIDQGMEPVKVSEDAEGRDPDGGRSAEGNLRCREMTCMRVPQRLRDQIIARKAKAAETQLIRRKEEVQRNGGKTFEKAYDIARRAGANDNQARNIASAAVKGVDSGYLNIRRG